MIGKDQIADAPLQGARVIIVIGPLGLGGAERQALLLARYLAREQKAEVEVWGYGAPGRVSELCDEYGLTWRSVSMPIPWSSDRFTQFKRLAGFALTLRRARPDVILPFMFFQSAACGIVWRLTGARACVWNQRDEGRDRLGVSEKVAVRLMPYFIANSEHGAEFLVKKLGAPPDRVRLVHNGVELSTPQRDRAAWRRELRVGDDCFLACMVANLHAFKDHATLLKAWRVVVDRLRMSGRDAVLLLAGRFDEAHANLKALAYDLELGRSVRFMGAVKDISGLLAAVDLGVHSSVNEGCPNGVLECMAAGLAVVGTDYLGIREAVGPQGYALLVPPGDSDALADMIIALASDDETCRKVGAANRQRIESEFNPRSMYHKTVSVIAESMRKGGRAPSRSSDNPVLAENQEAR
jgi:glycosyltransferase involved in cell wall biosynthesis